MESVRVRGCTDRIRLRAAFTAELGWDGRLADASRRRNGPRKAQPSGHVSSDASTGGDRRSRCGLEVSPASSAPSDTARQREKVISGGEAASTSAGGCGVEDQVGRTDLHLSRSPHSGGQNTPGDAFTEKTGRSTVEIVVKS